MSEEVEVSEDIESEEIERAKAQGWADKDEWKGDPEKWKPAKQFLEDGEKINAVLKERLDKVTEDGLATKAELKRLRQSTESLISHFDEQKKKAVEKAVRELKKERDEAITAGDTQRVHQLDDEIDQTRKETVKQVENDFSDWDDAFSGWKKDNDWYGDDMRMTVEADELGNKFVKSGRFNTSEGILKAVEKEMKRQFPDRFRNPAKDEPSLVEGANKSKSKPKKRGYDDLPQEAKKACDQFVRDIPGFTREKYIESYEWE